jgi:hypothetical protein
MKTVLQWSALNTPGGQPAWPVPADAIDSGKTRIDSAKHIIDSAIDSVARSSLQGDNGHDDSGTHCRRRLACRGSHLSELCA